MCCTRSPACVRVLNQRFPSGLGEHCRYHAAGATMNTQFPELDSLKDRWLLGEVPLADGTLFVRLNQAAAPYVADPRLSVKLGFAIPFNSQPEGGVPNPDENGTLASLEDMIRDAVSAATTGIHALTLTAPDAKELVFYIAEGADIGTLHESLRAQSSTHDVQCRATREPEWDSYRGFLPSQDA